MLSPVWHEWRDGGFNIYTGGASEGKVRHLQRDPRASLVVAEQVMPLRGLEVSGRATLSKDGFFDVLRRVVTRYENAQAAESMVAGIDEPGYVIRLVPERSRAWDFADEAGGVP